MLAVALLLVSLRTGYSFTESGRFHRLLNALCGGEDGVFESTLTRWGFLPPLPEGWQRDLVMFEMLESIRPLTLDEYALLLESKSLRYTAIKALEKAGDIRVIRPLFVDWRAGKAFDNQLPDLWARVGDKPFFALLSDPDAVIRSDVIDFLAAGRPRRAGDPLEASLPQFLADPDPDVRIAAGEFLAKRGNADAVSCLISEFNELASDGREERDWMRQANRGQITADEVVSRRRRFGRIIRVLRGLDDARSSESLRAYAERQLAREEREQAEALAASFGPEDENWELYLYLVPQAPHAGWYHLHVMPDHEPAIAPPYIVPTQNKAAPDEILAKFGAPDKKDSAATWETEDGEGEKIKMTGEAWLYGSELELLFVDGLAEWVRTSKPEARPLFGG